MRKVNYPDDRTELEKDFLKCFDGYDLQKSWEPLRKKLITWSLSSEKETLYPENISKLLVARYDVLVKMYLDYQIVKNRHRNKKIFWTTETKLKQLFNYTKESGSAFPAFQPMLADFFMRHAEELELHACHYCETAYINAYKEPSVLDDLAQFLKFGDPADIADEITADNGDALNSKTIASVLNLRNHYEENNIVEAFDSLACWKNPRVKKSEKLKRSKNRNHFDLDHFLPKSKCPLVGLSLYNFVPSCQVCNEKLKKDEELGTGNADKMLKLSPTSDGYQFSQEMRLQIMPAPLKLKVLKETEKYHLEFVPSTSDYQEEVKIFLLQERYNYHKCEAFRLYDKMTDYPPARIKMLKNDFGGLKTEKDIEEDLFGMEYMIEHHRCFTKMLGDVYEQHRRER